MCTTVTLKRVTFLGTCRSKPRMLECYLIPTAGQLLWGLQLLFPILTDTCSMQRGGDLSQDLRSGQTGVPGPHQTLCSPQGTLSSCI